MANQWPVNGLELPINLESNINIRKYIEHELNPNLRINKFELKTNIKEYLI